MKLRIENLSHKCLLLGLIAISVVIRLRYMFQERLWSDEALYSWNAMRIAGDPGMIFSKEIIEFHPPLFSTILALGYKILPALSSGRIISLIISLLCVWTIYILGKRISSSFTGIICALLLSFNSVFVKFTSKVLIDGIFMLFLMLLAMALFEIDGTKRNHNDLKVGAVGAIIILLKWPGVIVVPWIIFFYLVGLGNLRFSQRMKKLAIALALILGTIILLLINNKYQLHSFLPDMNALKEVTTHESHWWFYLTDINRLLAFPLAIVFVFIGLFYTVKEKGKIALLLISWITVFMISLSFASERISRYSLTYLPSLILFAAIGLERIIEKYFPGKNNKEVGCWLAVAAIGLMAYLQWFDIDKTLLSEKKYFIGFEGASAWIKGNISDETTIIANSHRHIRYYTGINYARFGGQLVEFPKTKEKIKELLDGLSGDVILVLDNWGKVDNLPIDPFDSSFRQYIEKIGYRSIKEIGKLRYTSPTGEKKVAPVIWIFKKDASSYKRE